jgi:hypothetical protein
MAMFRARSAIASDDWMHEQQLRAELEAEAWRRLRRDLATPTETYPPEYYGPPPADASAQRFDHHKASSAILKASVRFLMAGAMAYLAWLAAVDGGLGEFEIWLAVGGAFAVTLAASMLGFAREIVHALAEAARWGLIACLAIAGLWFAFQTWGLGG